MNELIEALAGKQAEESETLRFLRMLGNSGDTPTRVVVDTYLTGDTRNPWGDQNARVEPDSRRGD